MWPKLHWAVSLFFSRKNRIKQWQSNCLVYMWIILKHNQDRNLWELILWVSPTAIQSEPHGSHSSQMQTQWWSKSLQVKVPQTVYKRQKPLCHPWDGLLKLQWCFSVLATAKWDYLEPKVIISHRQRYLPNGNH